MSLAEPEDLRKAIDEAVDEFTAANDYDVEAIVELLLSRKYRQPLARNMKYLAKMALRTALRNHRRVSSVPQEAEKDLFGNLPRAKRIAVEYIDVDGKLVRNYKTRDELTIEDLDRLILRRERLTKESRALRDLREIRARVEAYRARTTNLAEALRMAEGQS